MVKKKKITKSMTIASVVNKYPQTAGVFMAHGMHCFGCALAQSETIEQGAEAHGNINLTKLIKDLNLSAERKLDAVEEKISHAEEEPKEIKKPSFFKRLFGRR